MSYRSLGFRGRRADKLAALAASLTFVGALATGARASSLASAPTRESPPIAHTGGFREPTCEHCHWGEPLNDPAGRLAVDGLPERFQSGASYRVTIGIRRPAVRTAGFELAARYADGPSVGKQAGTLRAIDDRATVTRNDTTGVQYAHHTPDGTTLTEPGAGAWVVEWTAPTSPQGSVVFHVVSNAGDENDSPLGDFIYSRAITVPRAEK